MSEPKFWGEDVEDVREAGRVFEDMAREYHDHGLPHAEERTREQSKRLLALADRIEEEIGVAP